MEIQVKIQGVIQLKQHSWQGPDYICASCWPGRATFSIPPLPLSIGTLPLTLNQI